MSSQSRAYSHDGHLKQLETSWQHGKQ